MNKNIIVQKKSVKSRWEIEKEPLKTQRQSSSTTIPGWKQCLDEKGPTLISDAFGPTWNHMRW